jgi:hypothetical protein
VPCRWRQAILCWDSPQVLSPPIVPPFASQRRVLLVAASACWAWLASGSPRKNLPGLCATKQLCVRPASHQSGIVSVAWSSWKFKSATALEANRPLDLGTSQCVPRRPQHPAGKWLLSWDEPYGTRSCTWLSRVEIAIEGSSCDLQWL